MRKIVSIVSLFILFFLFLTGCNNFKYKTRLDFKDEKEEVRKKLITDVLEENDIKVKEKYSIMFIDYLLTESDRFTAIDEQYPTPDFKEFFEKAVPTLYYAYSPDNYKFAPEKWKKEAKKFIVNNIPYEFNYGEEKFRKHISDDLDKGGDIGFVYYSKNKPEKAAKGYNENTSYYSFLTVMVWKDGNFDYGEFKQLTPRYQGEVIYFIGWNNVYNNKGEVNEEFINLLRRIKDKWIIRSDFYLKSSALSELGPSTPIDKLFDTITNVMFSK